MPFRSCPSCRRHVRASERVCPFCQAALPADAGFLPRLAVGGALLLSAAATTDCTVVIQQPTPTSAPVTPKASVGVKSTPTPVPDTGVRPLYGTVAPEPSEAVPTPTPEASEPVMAPMYGMPAPAMSEEPISAPMYGMPAPQASTSPTPTPKDDDMILRPLYGAVAPRGTP